MRPDKDLERFVQLIQAMASCKDRQADEAMMMGYELGLEDLPIEQIERAVRRAIREFDGMPSPADLRKLAGAPTDRDRAIMAWEVLLQAASLGAYKHVDFDDRIINATVRSLGGWPEFLSRLVGKEETWARKDFLDAYRALLVSGVNGEVCRPLSGLSEASVRPDLTVGPPAIVKVKTNLPPLPQLPGGVDRKRIACETRYDGRSRDVEPLTAQVAGSLVRALPKD